VLGASRLLGVGLVLCLGACATPVPAPQPVDASRTRVVLLPDEEGHVGAVWVTTPSGSREINQAYGVATVEGTQARLADAPTLDAARVNSEFKQVLDAQPSRPVSFTLYFLLGSTSLTNESKLVMRTVLATANARAPTEIALFGHADATGTEKVNTKLSADRAQLVADMIRSHEPGIARIDVQFFGDKDPLVPTPPNVPEPRNRRVEIVVF